MEPLIRASICLICFESIEKLSFVPSDAPAKILLKCNKYLHSTLTKDILKDIQLNNENQLPLCKSCFDSAWELTQLSEQLSTIQKEISDLTVTFSMTVFHRRSQIYSQSCNSSPKIEFNEACLPPNLFSTKRGDQNIQQSKSNPDILITSFDTQTDIVNIKHETIDLQVDNLSANPQASIDNDDAEIQINKDNLDEQPTIEENKNHAIVSEMRFVQLADGNTSNNCADPKNVLHLTMSDLLKSVQMPELKLKRINIECHEVGVQKVLDEPEFIDDESSDPTYIPNSSKEQTLLYKQLSFCKRKTAPQSHQKIRQRSKIRRQQVHKCSYCEKGYQKLDILQIHERIHTGENGGSLNLHAENHTGEKPFKCAFCEKRFNLLLGLKKHERIHTGEKPFECSFCKKKFTQWSTRMHHEKTHTMEKPYECSICQKKFGRQSCLKNHQNAHTGGKGFECSICKKEFGCVSLFKRHKKTHTVEKKYECSICEKKFIRATDMKIHQNIHTGEKPYKCSFCEQKFAQHATRFRHERIHTGEKPYQCSFCKKKFSDARTRKNHERTHNTEIPDRSNSHQMTHQKKVSSLTSPVCNVKSGTITVHLIRQKIHSTSPNDFKCSFCDITFCQDEDRIIHEKIHIKEQEVANENFIVGI